ncbi:hypothetical protein BKA69DRAFT_16189 [Paraphysoderma sedebokerense]|nr:hypothetical protein BKA69DRAFT_16189 [Paraphysoderma sedebokerense]
MIKNLLNLLFMNDKDVDKMDDSIIQIRKQLENERQSQIQELNNRRDENLKQLFCMLANIEYDNIVVDLDQSKFSLDEDRLKSLIEKYQLSHDQDIPHLPDSFETLMSLSPLRGTAARNKSSLSQNIGDQSEQSSQIQSVDENEDIQSSQIPLSSAGASDESLPSKISALSNAMSIDDEEMVPIKEEDVSQAPSRAPSQTPEPSNEPLDKVKMEDGSMDANGNNVKKRKIVPPPIERPVTRGITREAKSRDGTPGLPTTPSQLSAPPDINEFTEASKATINQSAPHYASGASILQHLQRQTVLQPLNSEKVDERRIASYKVQARMIHNPMFKCLQTANKSVSTSDWTVGLHSSASDLSLRTAKFTFPIYRLREKN